MAACNTYPRLVGEEGEWTEWQIACEVAQWAAFLSECASCSSDACRAAAHAAYYNRVMNDCHGITT